MRSLTRFSLILALSLVGTALVQSQDNTKTKGAITGRVTAANKAVAGVTVSVSQSGDPGMSVGKATTDDDGRFRISSLPAGVYYVWPFVPAYVVAEATGIYPQGKSVTVEDGETAEDINFSLTRGAAITGKVTDSAGRLIIDERIRILPVDQNLRRLVSSIYPNINDIRTDDRGIYRAFGLPAGKYKVAIGDQFGAFTSTRGRRFYPQTFHPNLTDETKAEMVELHEGEEVTNVDITVARSLTGFSVSGTVTDAENNQPVPGVSFGLTIFVGGSPSGFMSGNGVSTGTGGFRIDNLPPGRYAVAIRPGAGTGYYGESTPFDIGDADVNDLELKIHRTSTITGNVIVEGTADRLVLARLSQASLTVTLAPPGNGIRTFSYTTINPDGSFQIDSLQAGTAVIRLESGKGNTAPEFAALGIELNGVDKSQGLEISPGKNISGVRILAAYGTGTIRGTVRVEGGTVPSEQYISASFSRPGSSFSIAYTRVDTRGRFVFDHVPAGNYEVVVTMYLDRKAVMARQPVVASNGVVSEVTLTLKPTPSPAPGP